VSKPIKGIEMKKKDKLSRPGSKRNTHPTRKIKPYVRRAKK